MSDNVKALRAPANIELIEDLRRLANAVENGELDATFGVVLLSGLREQTITVSRAGDRRRLSEYLGLFAFASHHMYEEGG